MIGKDSRRFYDMDVTRKMDPLKDAYLLRFAK
ncbi:hypothetical protein Arad_7556 [Rhizobium rhizogenes K84]|uniref:Uncharacterized protein n=1 Tax=Rhizobium rhizogenes (strain K84 / ATCC BAA-868) TaxID=311403 RepID=B9JN99_RHIR8|nr:hypothetical protein Arad_7556 [Rhizobium rhizogenes K84]